ncbi:MAG: 3-isopropylmalate dehydrogenase [Planctomycetaceae bacterium]|nr:MAG: 3-isopropylmalate dehydrogenase [Planctomycetaceae bacterium]
MKATIILLPGDGIGPEVVAEARRVLEAVAQKYNHELIFEEHLIGGCAMEATGHPLPDETLTACRRADAILLGAVGGPRWDDPRAQVRPEQGLLKIRKELGLFANLRPIVVWPELIDNSPLRPELVRDVDILFFRELTGGLYFGESGVRPARDGSGEEAYNTMIYSTAEIERIVRLAAQAARQRRKKLTLIDKANVLEVSRLWRKTFERVMRTEFPDILAESILVDAAAMYLISRPRDFDVIVTENMFGDILTDEGSMLPGSMGMLPSASLGTPGPGLYEPIHGSAPDIAGKGIANPLATILAAAMLLRHSLNLFAEADAVECAVHQALKRGYRTRDLAKAGEPTLTTSQMGQQVVSILMSES